MAHIYVHKLADINFRRMHNSAMQVIKKTWKKCVEQKIIQFLNPNANIVEKQFN